ncbi:hypothetical protein OHS70_14030 [Streptomyces sp. NBC_00390]|uniref:hypothetical protein n=1 Tax=Streptomyces sp. NBC_00390 TaxID=2975736 RepID=UPI002E220EFD
MGGYEAEQLRCVRQHVEDDNMGEPAVALVRIGALNNTWHGDGATMLELVRALPQDSRLRLANAWAPRRAVTCSPASCRASRSPTGA